MTGYPEPPSVGSGTDTLLGSLERQRAAFAWVGEDPPGPQHPFSLG